VDLFDFRRRYLQLWRDQLRKLARAHPAGRIPAGPLAQVQTLYPTHILFTETPTHYIAEVTGASEELGDPKVFTYDRGPTTHQYFNVFQVAEPGDSVVRVGKSRLCGLTVATPRDHDQVCRRFPYLDIDPSQQPVLTGSAENAIYFQSEDCLASVERCLFINRQGSMFRFKYASSACVISKDVIAHEFEQEFQDMLERALINNRGLLGTTTVFQHRRREAAAIRFASLCQSQHIRETTLDSWLARHPELLCEAFGCTKAIRHPRLRIIERVSSEDVAYLEPDYMLQHATSECDIVDLKRPRQDLGRITKAASERRRFIDYVQEGIAQLAAYKEYFAHAAHRRYALDEYGIQVTNPKLYLVVGTYENASPQEISEAARSLRPEFTVIDYDSIVALYLANGQGRR
jgi:hypothetical protein